MGGLLARLLIPICKNHPRALLGKQFGVLTACWLAVRLGWAKLPTGADWRDLHGVAILTGIGFTMSLFIGLLAFPASGQLQAETKVGVLLGSLLSAVAGWVVLRLAAKTAVSRPG